MKNNNKKSSKKTGQAQVVTERREFYKDSYKSLSRLAMVSVGCLIGSIGLTTYALNAKHENVYIAASDSGQIVNLVALSAPNMKDANVSDWVANALVDTFNFNFSDIQQSLNSSAQAYFTQEGGEALISALEESGNFDAVINQKLIVTMVTEHTPVVTRKFFDSRAGRYTWHLEVPAIITYRTQTQEYSNEVLLSVAVTRISLREDPKGLGISKIIMENRG